MNNTTDKKLFSGKVLMSDLDGTMINQDYSMPERNIEAVRRFTNLGGKAVVATGRSVKSARPFIEKLGIVEPCVIFNGAAVYDYLKKEYVIIRPIMREDALDCMREIICKYPALGVEVLCEDKLYMVRRNEKALHHALNEHEPFLDMELEDTPEKWLKVVLSGEKELIDAEISQITELIPPQLRAIRSMPVYIELLSAGVDKFSTALMLLEMMGVSRDDCFAIGDYYNDIELIGGMGLGAAPSSAPEEVRNQADYVACPCENGAVADFIDYLEKEYRRQMPQ